MPVAHHAYGPPAYRLVLPPVWPCLGRPLNTVCRDEITLMCKRTQAGEGGGLDDQGQKGGPPRRSLFLERQTRDQDRAER